MELHFKVKGRFDLMAIIILLRSAITDTDQSKKKGVATLIFIRNMVWFSCSRGPGLVSALLVSFLFYF